MCAVSGMPGDHHRETLIAAHRCMVRWQDDGFIDDDDADQIEPGYIVRRVKKKDFSGEELEGWDHYPSVEYVQVLSSVDLTPADEYSFGQVSSFSWLSFGYIVRAGRDAEARSARDDHIHLRQGK